MILWQTKTNKTSSRKPRQTICGHNADKYHKYSRSKRTTPSKALFYVLCTAWDAYGAVGGWGSAPAFFSVSVVCSWTTLVTADETHWSREESAYSCIWLSMLVLNWYDDMFPISPLVSSWFCSEEPLTISFGDENPPSSAALFMRSSNLLFISVAGVDILCKIFSCNAIEAAIFLFVAEQRILSVIASMLFATLHRFLSKTSSALRFLVPKGRFEAGADMETDAKFDAAALCSCCFSMVFGDFGLYPWADCELPPIVAENLGHSESKETADIKRMTPGVRSSPRSLNLLLFRYKVMMFLNVSSSDSPEGIDVR